MSERPVIEVDRLVRRFKRFEAVRGVSFHVEEGELFGFLGPNGAGKTTTINMLTTLLRPTAGEATVGGFSVRTERQRVRESIGVVFQDQTVDETLTGWENLRIHADIYDIPRAVFRQRAEEVLRLVELGDWRKKLVREYSGGMKRRLEIARGLLHYPRVLFLDEPTLGLDPQSRVALWDYVRDIQRREGITVFLTTHYLAEAEYCARIAVMDHGEIVALDTPDHLKDLVGGDVIAIRTEDNETASRELVELLHVQPTVEDGLVRFETTDGAQALARMFRELSPEILSLDLHKPSLDDVFIHLTGRALRDEEPNQTEVMRETMRMGRRMFGMREV